MDLTYPTGALGQDANIRQVKVDLPKAAPARLTTLQKACTAAQFNANPAGCPAPSLIGTARAITPILPVPLEGPAGTSSAMAVKGSPTRDGAPGRRRHDRPDGERSISKAGITSSTFTTVPDQPVTSFELKLPEGPYGARATNGNLCPLTKTVTVKKKVTVRSRPQAHRHAQRRTQPQSLRCRPVTGQNGAEIKEDTPIAVTNCPKVKQVKKAKRRPANVRPPSTGKKSGGN